ncbi:MAG TPA: hypothetical protein PKC25_06480 [Candidatus Rifleibacterium sp.]|nr:hypothetical protein [Candidatus Rifleibacterium sp.]
MASLRQQYYKSYIEFKQSDAFKSLSAEERAQINRPPKRLTNSCLIKKRQCLKVRS